LACPSVSLCVAAVTGDSRGYVATATHPHGGSAAWKSTLVASSIPTFQGVPGYLGIATCPRVSLCLLDLNDSGTLIVSTHPNGGAAAWSTTTIAPNEGLGAAACTRATLCVIGDSAGRLIIGTGPPAPAPTAPRCTRARHKGPSRCRRRAKPGTASVQG
jgi:hypothetical protein